MVKRCVTGSTKTLRLAVKLSEQRVSVGRNITILTMVLSILGPNPNPLKKMNRTQAKCHNSTELSSVPFRSLWLWIKPKWTMHLPDSFHSHSAKSIDGYISSHAIDGGTHASVKWIYRKRRQCALRSERIKWWQVQAKI